VLQFDRSELIPFPSSLNPPTSPAPPTLNSCRFRIDHTQVLNDESNPFAVVDESSTNPFRRIPATDPGKSRSDRRPMSWSHRRSDGAASPFARASRTPTSNSPDKSGLRTTEPPIFGAVPSSSLPSPVSSGHQPVPTKEAIEGGVHGSLRQVLTFDGLSGGGLRPHRRESNPFLSGTERSPLPTPSDGIDNNASKKSGLSSTHAPTAVSPASAAQGDQLRHRAASSAAEQSAKWNPAAATAAPLRRRFTSSTLPNNFGLDKSNPFFSPAPGAPSTVPRIVSSGRPRRVTVGDGALLDGAPTFPVTLSEEGEARLPRRTTNPFLDATDEDTPSEG
jgi:hypothetical protein